MLPDVVDLKAYRTLKECRRLFIGYELRLKKQIHSELMEEFSRYRQETRNFPNHLLTLVKGEILMKILSEHAKTAALFEVLREEQNRINQSLTDRLRYQPPTPPTPSPPKKSFW